MLPDCSFRVTVVYVKSQHHAARYKTSLKGLANNSCCFLPIEGEDSIKNGCCYLTAYIVYAAMPPSRSFSSLLCTRGINACPAPLESF